MMNECPGFDVLTIGYEAASVEDFLDRLVSARITLVLDIREIASSRRRGFAKTALQANLRARGIAYRHERRLGSPRDIRHRLRENGDFSEFFLAFDRHLNTQSDLLESLATQLSGRVALLCYERNHLGCHRHRVADRFGRILDKNVEHLIVRHPLGGSE